MSDDEREDDSNHPALKNFNRGIFQAKHVAGKTLKYGAIGAAAAGIGIPALAALAGVFGLAASGPVGWLISVVGGSAAIGTGVALPALGAIATNMALIGGTAGAAIGAVTGASGADEAAEEEEEKRKAKYEQREVRHEQQEALAMRRTQQQLALEAQAQQMGLHPGALPHKTADGPQVGG